MTKSKKTEYKKAELLEFLSLNLASILPEKRVDDKVETKIIIRNYEDRFLRIFIRLMELNYYLYVNKISNDTRKKYFNEILKFLSTKMISKEFIEARYSSYILNKKNIKKQLKKNNINTNILPTKFQSYSEVIIYAINANYINKGKIDSLKILIKGIYVQVNKKRNKKKKFEYIDHLEVSFGPYNQSIPNDLINGLNNIMDYMERENNNGE